MIRSYTQRLLPPFSGVVQIAESERARAQSFDGTHWDIQYFSGNEHAVEDTFRIQGYGLDKGYFNVANLHKHELKTFNFPACVDHGMVSESINELYEFLSTAQLPFPAGDNFEYWLLDEADESPLALLNACCDESVMDMYPSQTEWTALPHSKMDIENTESEQTQNEPPVNHRFQNLIARRAGMNPRAAWFKRVDNGSADFPGLLIREDWQEQAHHDLCQRYLMRMAPRLLMLHGLTTEDRERLEVAAKQYVFEVDEYFSLYPAVNDKSRMSAMRVEARIRRASPEVPKTGKKQKVTGPAQLDKDMRIFET